MQTKFQWLLKKTLRSVDQLKLWPENPRLNPDESHSSLRDFAEDLTYEKSDRDDFFQLINSIVRDGFIPADPIVVWKHEVNDKFYVAEGNRRVVALKLLRNPDKAPKSIRNFIKKASKGINLTEIEKIPVSVAPSFEDAEWYINQRNSASSLQRRWSRIQQQRWIETLYEKYGDDEEKILSITNLSISEIEGFIRILKIKDLIKTEQVKQYFSKDEYEKANSYRFPITILERFFNFTEVKDKWGLRFDGTNIRIISNKKSFYKAFSELIKRIVNETEEVINTRLNREHLPKTLESLPKVTFDDKEDGYEEDLDDQKNKQKKQDKKEDSIDKNNGKKKIEQSKTAGFLKNNPDRKKLVLEIYELNTTSARLYGLFEEFKKVSLSYKNSVAASLRVFLDLAVFEYIDAQGLKKDLKNQYKCDLRDVPLKKRLEFLKTKKLTGKPQTIVSKLLEEKNQYSLDVLNGYVHGKETQYLNKQFLNGFWDELFPLFKELLDISEKND